MVEMQLFYQFLRLRRITDAAYGGVMPSFSSSNLCPVKSFSKYLSCLHPGCTSLWQRPKDSFADDDQTWYFKFPIGFNKLSSFIPDLSKKLKLSKVYTNHSIRSTSIYILSNDNFNPYLITSVSGQKSVTSVESYTSRVDDSEKLLMAEKLNNACVANVTDGNVQVVEEVEQVLDHFDVSEDCDVFNVSEDGVDELLTSLPEQALMSFGTKTRCTKL